MRINVRDVEVLLLRIIAMYKKYMGVSRMELNALWKCAFSNLLILTYIHIREWVAYTFIVCSIVHTRIILWYPRWTITIIIVIIILRYRENCLYKQSEWKKRTTRKKCVVLDKKTKVKVCSALSKWHFPKWQISQPKAKNLTWYIFSQIHSDHTRSWAYAEHLDSSTSKTKS